MIKTMGNKETELKTAKIILRKTSEELSHQTTFLKLSTYSSLLNIPIYLIYLFSPILEGRNRNNVKIEIIPSIQMSLRIYFL